MYCFSDVRSSIVGWSERFDVAQKLLSLLNSYTPKEVRQSCLGMSRFYFFLNYLVLFFVYRIARWYDVCSLWQASQSVLVHEMSPKHTLMRWNMKYYEHHTLWCFSCPVHTTPKDVENTALFLQLGLPLHTIPSWKRSFSKTLLKPEEFENARILVWTKNITKTELFESGDITVIMWFACLSFPQLRIQNDQSLLRFIPLA